MAGFELGIQRAFDNERTHNGAQAGQTEPNEDMRQVRQRKAVSKMSRSTGGIRAADKSNQLQPRNKRTAFCIGYSEIDKYAIETYEHNFGKETKNFGDATTINTAELPDFDLLVGGFPCQAFSVAGKRAGFNDTRGTLIFDVVRILRDKRPRYFVLENVKGLLSHEGGKTFAHILEILTDSGYDVSWSVHNSKNYGVPQNRERIYLIGNLRGERRPQVFPITTVDRTTLNEHTEKESQGYRVYGTDGVSTTIASQAGGIGAKTGLYLTNDKGDISQGLSEQGTTHPTIDANYYKGISNQRQALVQAVLTPDRLEKRQNGRRFKENGEPSFTLNTQDRHGIYDGVKIRRLTPTECERLQGFPDNWTIGSDTQRYKQCGNAVTVNVVEHVIRELLAPPNKLNS